MACLISFLCAATQTMQPALLASTPRGRCAYAVSQHCSQWPWASCPFKAAKLLLSRLNFRNALARRRVRRAAFCRGRLGRTTKCESTRHASAGRREAPILLAGGLRDMRLDQLLRRADHHLQVVLVEHAVLVGVKLVEHGDERLDLGPLDQVELDEHAHDELHLVDALAVDVKRLDQFDVELPLKNARALQLHFPLVRQGIHTRDDGR
mmetsp:Transcript_2675/g.6226  ORF Transcript_2675/g.6226 Transcript_2675/m.6226 type:complete len:208 (-) Transcript_2675:913-1536(-)